MNNWFEFLGFVVDKITWPVTIIILVRTLRDPLSNAIKRLGKVRFKGFEAHFTKELEEVSECIELKFEKMPIENDSKNIILDEFIEIAEISPMTAIPFAYSHIEKALKEIALKCNDYNEKNICLVDNIEKYLLKKEKIDDGTYNIINKMKKLRQLISNKNDEIISMDKKGAMEYGKNAEKLLRIISTIR